MNQKKSKIARIAFNFIGSGLLLLTLNFFPSFAAEPGSSTPRFRLGPTIEEAEEAEKSKELKEENTFEYTPKMWNEMIRTLEEGRQPGVPLQQIDISSKPVTPPKPPPGLLNVELPYESSLSITGRKVIKLDITNTHITKERAEELGTKQDTQTFNMEQELQARIQGTVARKTTINVNFDDTKENVKDFSVVYKGDPDEVVQEAAFGDIVLSLPATEFVNYNKQLFGIRAALRYKRAGLMVIGSRTKGTTETQRFTGTTKRQQIFVNDTAYTRRKFYDLTFATASAMSGPGGVLTNPGVPPVLPINGNQPEDVYIEDAGGLNDDAVAVVIALATSPTTAVTIRMRKMSPGVEYTVDRLKGIITFTNALPEDVRVAVDYTLSDATTRLRSLAQTSVPVVAFQIKDKTPETPQASQEIKRFYSTGARNIVRDNGLGNFQLKVLDKNREKEIGDTLNPIQRYPDTIEMKFETGIFELKQRLPFDEVYAANVITGSPLQAVFSVEFQAIVRTFTLKPNIVLQSETVLVNGRKVSRDLDYFIDYDVGILTFFNEDLIRESTVIEVTYEFAPFGGVLGETLVGARGTFDILNNFNKAGAAVDTWSAGSTVLYNFAAKPTSPPDVRANPSSLLVTEGDTSIKGLRFGKIPIVTNASAEVARSKENPNLFGKALIDSMEGIKQEDAASLVNTSWAPAANPFITGTNRVADFQGEESGSSHLRWNSGDVDTTDPNDGSAQQKALIVDYTLNTGNNSVEEQVSMVQVLSISGRDFSKKTTLEVELDLRLPNPAGVELEIAYGSFNEDTDGDNLLDTEDLIPYDGVLNLGEDVGWLYDGPGPDLTFGSNDVTTRVGVANTRLDSEDLNGDRVLSTSDNPATLEPLFKISSDRGETDTQGNLVQDLNFTGRRLFQIPLNIKSRNTEEQARLTSVKQVRITIRNSNLTSSATGSFFLTKLAMVGNSYEPAELSETVQSTMTILAINNKDTTSYISLIGNPDYNNLYKDSVPASDAREQSLAIDYDLSDGSSGTTKNFYSAPRDFSRHKQFKFFVRRPLGCGIGNCGGNLFLQAGSETEYQQVTIPIASIPDTSWRLITLRQSDANRDGTPETWEATSPDITVTKVGAAPNLTQVAQMKIGIQNSSGARVKHQVWINEIHVTEPNEREGNARKYAFDTSWPNWMDFGGSYRDVDRNWQTPTTAVTNQDSTQQSSYLNFNRISFMPMTFKTSRDVTITPSAFRSNANALVSFLDEGRVEKRTQGATGKLILPNLPIFDFSYSTDNNENTITKRIDSNHLFTGGATYSPKSQMDLMPGSRLTFRPIPSSITLFYSYKVTKLRFKDLEELRSVNISTAPFDATLLTQYLDEREARAAFRPWDGFTFNPTFKVRTETEKRNFRGDELNSLPSLNDLDNRITPRSLSQTLTASGNLKLLKWLDPRYNYSFSGTETNGLPTQTNTTAYMMKTITRNSSGELTAAIQMSQVLPIFKLLNSMNLNTSYRLENGDTYNDMPENFNWRNKLWASSPLVGISTGTSARRVDATDRRTLRSNLAWQPFSAYSIANKRLKPLSTMSLTSNFLTSREETETTGTTKRVNSLTFPDLIFTINDSEDFFNVQRAIDNSRLVLRTNTRLVETVAITKSRTDTWGTDYQFQFFKKLDFSTTFNLSKQREDNLVTNQLSSKTDTLGYSLQTRIPWRVWAFTPRYEHSETESRDSIRLTNDLKNDILSLQIYGDVSKPLGIRFGRREVGLANRFILNSTVKWDKKRSNVNPSTGYLDTYTATMTGDYTISQNFRLAIGGGFNYEVHHPDFKKLDTTSFNINSTLTIQF